MVQDIIVMLNEINDTFELLLNQYVNCNDALGNVSDENIEELYTHEAFARFVVNSATLHKATTGSVEVVETIIGSSGEENE